MFLMWLGEQITEKGVGNGISMLIFAGIVAGFPAAVGTSLTQAYEGQINGVLLLVVGLIAVGVVGCIVYVERAQRRITVNYAKRQQGRKMYQAQASHLPLKINMAGVIPAIFASSILLFPASLGQWFGQSEGAEWLQDLALLIGPGQPLYIIIFSAMIIFSVFSTPRWYSIPGTWRTICVVPAPLFRASGPASKPRITSMASLPA